MIGKIPQFLFFLFWFAIHGDTGGHAFAGDQHPTEMLPIGMAVEFMDHAACAYVAKEKGWFELEGLHIAVYKSYVSGMALAAGLARGDIQVAYMCLVPAINVYANAQVPVKVVAGTHKHGYGLVVKPEKVKDIESLNDPSVRLGCVREGGAVDVVMRKTIDRYRIAASRVLTQTRRMNAPKLTLAMMMGQLDAAFLPEQWATMAEDFGFRMLITTQEVWSEMQGSVLVVKQELIRNNPQVVKALVAVTKKATEWLNTNRDRAAVIVARSLSSTGSEFLPAEGEMLGTDLRITPQIISRSMDRMVFTTDLDLEVVQDVINYMAHLGYIKRGIRAQDIVDMSFLHDEAQNPQ